MIIIIKVSNSTCKGNSTQAECFCIMNRMAPISAWWSSATGYKGLQIIRSRFFLSQLCSARSGPAAEQLQIGCREWTHSASTAIVSEALGLQLLCLVTEPYPALHRLWKDTKRADIDNWLEHLEVWYCPRVPGDASLPTSAISQVKTQKACRLLTLLFYNLNPANLICKAKHVHCFLTSLCFLWCIPTIPTLRTSFLSLPSRTMPYRGTFTNALGRAPAAFAWERVPIACGDRVRLYFPLSKFK